MQISGQAALVTGGASGLGAAVVAGLRAAGAKVTILDMNADAGQALAAKYGAAFQPCDVTSESSAEAALAAARAAHGPARILVNCAGVADAGRIVGRDGPLALEAFAKVININLIGTFNLMRLAAADMAALDAVKGERGVIINTASAAAFEGQIGQAAYAASKGGVAALTLPAARDLARHAIRVMAIAPGLFATPMLRALPESVQVDLAATIPNPARLGEPTEFAALVDSIITNPYLNGEVIRLDGALRMGPK